MRVRNNEKKHIHNAIQSLAKAQEVMSDRLDRHELIMDSQAREITELQGKVMDLRDCAIKADLNAGMKGKDVALKYSLSPARVTQIKNA
jgi:mRNA-degrading endonuclease YafQ of YafQ-DinJ toxin-antitoxin module